jgi:hypothetical protein
MDPMLHLFQQRPKENWAWTLDPSRVTWSRDNALALANCALLAYSDPKFVEGQLRDRGFDDVQWCDPLSANVRCVNDRDVVPHVPPRTLSGIERILGSGALPGLAELAGTGQTYAHCGQLRLLLPEGGCHGECGGGAVP